MADRNGGADDGVQDAIHWYTLALRLRGDHQAPWSESWCRDRLACVRWPHGPIRGVLPFDGVRNPGSRSATSHRVWFTYQTEANGWKPKVSICASTAEQACGLEFLIEPDTYDLRFQPLTVSFEKEGGGKQPYTHDLLWTARNGHRRLVFVRHETNLSKPYTWRDIAAIAKATPSTAAADMIVVNAND